jgi:hypothetical protein
MPRATCLCLALLGCASTSPRPATATLAPAPNDSGVSTAIDGRTFTVRSARIFAAPNGTMVLALGDHEQGCAQPPPPEGRTLLLSIPWSAEPSALAEDAYHALVEIDARRTTTRTAQVLGATSVLDPEAAPGGTVRVRLALDVDGSTLLGEVVALYCR